MSSIPFIIIAVSIAVVGQLFIKAGLNTLGDISFSQNLLASYIRIFLSPLVLLGTITYFISVLFWLYVLSKVDLSFAYPFLAFSYVLVTLASHWFLGETIPPFRWAGVLVICFGVIMVART